MTGITFRLIPIAVIISGATLLSKKATLLTLIFFAIIGSLKGQNIQQINPRIPTSPQAEAFKQYGEYAINYSVGTPDISIPLYQINHQGYKMPLDLKYNPRPLKPGYNYDVYGHGWGLSVHSSVSRTIEFLPDEERQFKIESNKLSEVYFRPGGKEPIDLSNYNFAHDKFNVVLPNGSSFDFIIDYNDGVKNTYTISDGRKVKISCASTGANINSFTIIDEDGVKYTFAGSDTAHWLSGAPSSGTYISWQLTRIDLPHTKAPITFSYDYNIESSLACAEPQIIISHQGSDYGPVPVNAAMVPANVSYSYRMKLLSSITYGSTSIELVYQNPGTTAEYNYVDKIEIREHSTLLQEISLKKNISPFHGPHCKTGLFLAKLDSVIVKSPNESDDPQVYSCTYTSVNAHGGIDHWGYLNYYSNEYDVANFNLFIPFDPVYHHLFSAMRMSPVTKSLEDLNPYYKVKLCYPNGPNGTTDMRQPAGPESHGVLSRLRFPSGGHTDFEFENHEFLTSTDINGNYIYDRANRRKAKAAGFRIRKISNYTGQGAVPKIMEYRYGQRTSAGQHTGLGLAVVDPNILTYMNYSHFVLNGPPHFIRNMILGLDNNGERTSFSNPFSYESTDLYYQQVTHWKWECSFSPLNFRRILNGRPPVVYPEVTVYYGSVEENAGKTVYRFNLTTEGFDLFGNFRTDIFFEEPRYIGNTLDYESRSYQYNQMKDKTDYDAVNCVSCDRSVKIEQYSWSNHAQVSSDLAYATPLPSNSGPSYPRIGDILTYKNFYYGVSLLGSKTISTGMPADPKITSFESFIHNSDYQVKQILSKNSDNKAVEKTFVYPGNQTEPISAITQKMLDKNIISPVLETTEKIDGKLISGSKVDYNEFTIDDGDENTTDPKIIMPAKTYELELKPSGNEYVVKNQINRYTTNGNPLEFISSDGIHSSYLWDFNARYLLLKADNIAYSDLSNIVTASLPPGAQFQPQLGKLSSIDWNAFNSNLRANLPDNAMVTTYTYTLAGKVSSITDPNNITTYYSYDGFGRLTTVKDNDGNIVNRTEYNLKE